MPDGQFLGTRGKYVYTDDGGKDLILTVDNSLAAISTTLSAFDPANPGTAVPAPRRFKPRGLWWQGTAAGYTTRRKFIIIGDISEGKYGVNVPAAFQIDGIDGKFTGRRGEKMTY